MNIMSDSQCRSGDRLEKSVHLVTEQHVLYLTGKRCACVEDLLIDGPCRHRRKVAKQITKSGSEISE